MAWVEMIPPEAATGGLAEAYARIQGTRGRIANVLQASSLLPQVLDKGVEYYLALMFGQHTLPRGRRELVAVEVSRTNDCTYCVEHHQAALARVWGDKVEARKFATTGTSKRLEAADQEMLKYARALTTRPNKVGATDVQALRDAGFQDSEIVAINHIVGYFNMMNRIVSGLGVDLEPDKGADPRYKY